MSSPEDHARANTGGQLDRAANTKGELNELLVVLASCADRLQGANTEAYSVVLKPHHAEMLLQAIKPISPPSEVINVETLGTGDEVWVRLKARERTLRGGMWFDNPFDKVSGQYVLIEPRTVLRVFGVADGGPIQPSTTEPSSDPGTDPKAAQAQQTQGVG